MEEYESWQRVEEIAAKRGGGGLRCTTSVKTARSAKRGLRVRGGGDSDGDSQSGCKWLKKYGVKWRRAVCHRARRGFQAKVGGAEDNLGDVPLRRVEGDTQAVCK